MFFGIIPRIVSSAMINNLSCLANYIVFIHFVFFHVLSLEFFSLTLKLTYPLHLAFILCLFYIVLPLEFFSSVMLTHLFQLVFILFVILSCFVSRILSSALLSNVPSPFCPVCLLFPFLCYPFICFLYYDMHTYFLYVNVFVFVFHCKLSYLQSCMFFQIDEQLKYFEIFC